ncbi:MAG: hypothetical protein U0R19_12135 [Bryobacteraceae bacterium]
MATSAAASSLTDTLALAARHSEQLLERVTGVTCVETLEQRKFDAKNRLLARQDGQYAYTLLIQITPDRLFADESRELRGKGGKRPAHPLLASNGFATLSLIFHPLLQSSFRFTALDPGPEPGVTQHVAFEHINGQRTPSLLQTTSGSIPIEWRGEAWIDPSTGAVTRIRAEWNGPGQSHALRRLAANVNYAPVNFTAPSETHWLPQSADIEVLTAHSLWRNHHDYSSYSRFSVSTEIRLGEVK